MSERKIPTEPMADEYTVINDHYEAIPMEDGYIITDAPSLVKTSDGGLLCAVPMLLRGTPKEEVNPLWFFKSDDDGQSWSKLPAESRFCSGTLIPQGNTLYFLGTGPHHRDGAKGVRIIRSDDEGQTWTEPVELYEGPYYQPAGGYVVRDGQLYWCFDSGRDTTYVIAGDFSRDLTDPDAWRISNSVSDPGIPPSLTVGEGNTRWLEGNVVDVNGQLRVSWRYMIDGRSTVGLGVICDLEDDGETLDYSFTQFHPLPGAQNQMYIVYDEVTDLFWMTANLPTRSQDKEFAEKLNQNPRYAGSPGKERRILALYLSFDALNWLPAGYVKIWPRMRQASNYCGLLIDGEDLLVACRTSRDGRNQHDNDLTTFHRVENFRRLAEPFELAEEE